jgi:SAM-dependent methyltransferase
MHVDFGKTAEDYCRHRAGFPAALFDRLATYGVGDRGQKVLDLGTGTGSLARGFAARGCEVVGLDPSPELIEEAKRLDAADGVRIHYVEATAERTMLDESHFDVVSAGQAWLWFDTAKAIREVKRILKPGGNLVIAHFDWLPLPGNVIELTEKLIESYNPEWDLGDGSGLHPEAVMDVRRAGFTGLETFSFDVLVAYTHESWRGRVRASAGVKASLAPDEVARFDEKLRRGLAEQFPDEPMMLPHCVWALVARAPD